jgi:CrcB protein
VVTASEDRLERRHLTEPDAVAEAELAHAPADRQRPFRLWHPRLSSFTAIGVGGLLGANARYQVGNWVVERWGSAFPWGTLLINVSGSLVLGFFLTLATERVVVRPTTRLLIATGFLGAYTTFSTFSYEAVRLFQSGDLVQGVAYVGGSLIAGVAAIVAGTAAARLWR